ncbi:hypothetical protein HZB01_02305 [Candidatus Woesearchaeota archaeon]|nr:hypothetical protein [Candidatus Woesearchaeota archaeon]
MDLQDLLNTVYYDRTGLELGLAGASVALTALAVHGKRVLTAAKQKLADLREDYNALGETFQRETGVEVPRGREKFGEAFTETVRALKRRDTDLQKYNGAVEAQNRIRNSFEDAWNGYERLQSEKGFVAEAVAPLTQHIATMYNLLGSKEMDEILPAKEVREYKRRVEQRMETDLGGFVRGITDFSEGDEKTYLTQVAVADQLLIRLGTSTKQDALNTAAYHESVKEHVQVYVGQRTDDEMVVVETALEKAVTSSGSQRLYNAANSALARLERFYDMVTALKVPVDITTQKQQIVQYKTQLAAAYAPAPTGLGQ